MTLHTVMTNRWRCMVGFGCKPTHRRVTSRQSVKTARSSPREHTTRAQRTRPNGDHPQYVLLGDKVKVKFPRAQVLISVIVGMRGRRRQAAAETLRKDDQRERRQRRTN